MIGRPRLHLREAGSTNERARELAVAGAPHGTLVTAERQTAGRGRQGRRWEAPPGRAVLMSLLLRELGHRHALLPLAAAVATCEACEACAPVRCAIKWPNDVWIDRRKVAGILVEGRPKEGWSVLGVGVNVTTAAEELPEDLRAAATSLAIAAGASAPVEEQGPPRLAAARDVGRRDRPAEARRPERAAPGAAPDVESVLAALLARLDDRLGDSPDAVLDAWRRRDALRGERVSWAGGEGRAEGIADTGALLVSTARGRLALDAGEVHLQEPPSKRPA